MWGKAYFCVEEPVRPDDAEELNAILPRIQKRSNQVFEGIDKLPDHVSLQPGDAAFLLGRRKVVGRILHAQPGGRITSVDGINLGFVTLRPEHLIRRGLKNVGRSLRRSARGLGRLVPSYKRKTQYAQGQHGTDEDIRNLMVEPEAGHFRGPDKKGFRADRKAAGVMFMNGVSDFAGNDAIAVQVFHTDTLDYGPVGGDEVIGLIGAELDYGTLATLFTIWTARTPSL